MTKEMGVTKEILLAVRDSWQNFITGLGVRGRDKSRGMRFYNRKPLTFTELDALYAFDSMAGRIVDDIVEDGFRCGWKLKFSKGGKSIDSEMAAQLNARVKAWHKATLMPQRVEEHMKWSRAYGGANLIVGADDGGEPFEELNAGALKSFAWMRSVDRFQLTPGFVTEGNPAKPGYGKPLHYTVACITPTHGIVDESPWSISNLRVHSSRMFRSEGLPMNDRMQMVNDGWGLSVLERPYDDLADYASIKASSRAIVADFSQGVYKIKDLVGQLSADRGTLLARFKMMDYVRSSVNAILLDADGEDFQRQTTSVAGLSDLMTHAQIALSSSSGEPMTKLFGLSPGGFGTGEAEGDNWDDKVKAWQDKYLRPVLAFVYRILFATPEFKDVPSEWEIEFAPLQLESPAETADTKLKNAQHDAVYIDRGVIAPGDVAESRFGGERYGEDLDLGESSRGMHEADDDDDVEAAELNERAAAPESVSESGSEQATDDVQSQALNGAQVASLRDLMEDAKSGTDVEAVVAAAMFAFPTMSEQEARRIFEPLARQYEPERNAPAAPPANLPPQFAASKKDEEPEEKAP